MNMKPRWVRWLVCVEGAGPDHRVWSRHLTLRSAKRSAAQFHAMPNKLLPLATMIVRVYR